MNVMLIEDEEDDYRLLLASCRAQHLACTVERHADGEHGLQALNAAKLAGRLPDMVLIDMSLPGMPGYEVLRRIRADPLLASLVVVMLTGSSAPEDREVSRAAHHYLVKPQAGSDWSHITSVIAGYLNRAVKPGTDRLRQSALLANVCVLHIDDDENDRRLFAHAFAKSGLGGELRAVASASEALRFLNRLGEFSTAPRPRLIILDLSLPLLDGRELLELLKGNTRFRAIPIIVLTGSENYADMQRCREMGVEDYVVKPTTAQELVEMIASFNHWMVGSRVDSPKLS